MRTGAAIGAIFMLQGCAVDWVRTEQVDSVAVHHFSVVDVGLACYKLTGIRADACFQRTVSCGRSECDIYTQPNPPKYIWDHEVKHCWGWDHS